MYVVYKNVNFFALIYKLLYYYEITYNLAIYANNIQIAWFLYNI